MISNDFNSRLVYSTSHGSICPGCAKPVDNCTCHEIKKAAVPNTGGVVRLRYETNGRKGKGMTLITGLSLSEAGLLDLAKKLKQRFGRGGSVKDYCRAIIANKRRRNCAGWAIALNRTRGRFGVLRSLEKLGIKRNGS